MTVDGSGRAQLSKAPHSDGTEGPKGLADSARGGCITYGLFMFRCICRPGYRHVAAYLLVTGCLRQQVVGDAEKRVHIVGAL